MHQIHHPKSIGDSYDIKCLDFTCNARLFRPVVTLPLLSKDKRGLSGLVVQIVVHVLLLFWAHHFSNACKESFAIFLGHLNFDASSSGTFKQLDTLFGVLVRGGLHVWILKNLVEVSQPCCIFASSFFVL